MASSTRKLTVAYDVAFLGMGHINPKSRTGIFRVTQETLFALLKRPELDVKLVNLSDKLAIWDEVASQLYLESLGLDIEDAFIHTFPKAWLRTLRFAVSLQRRLIQHTYQSFPLLYKAGIAAQIPVDKLSRLFKQPQQEVTSVDLYHSSFLPLPAVLASSSVPRILTIHDLIPISHPEFCTPKTIARFERILSSIDPKKDWIICVSEATRQDLCTHLAIDPERTFTVPLAAADYFYPVTDAAAIATALRPYGLAPKGYLLSLATIEPRKNLEFLIRGFLKLHQEQPDCALKLLLVGPSGWRNTGIFDAAAQNPELAKHIIFTGYLPDQALSAIYSGALAFVYPSIYEGFGLPPLEAMQCGVPVIASNTSSLPEVVGDAGILIDPTDEHALCQSILSLLNDATLQEALSNRGLARARQFSWATYAEKLSTIYHLAAEAH